MKKLVFCMCLVAAIGLLASCAQEDAGIAGADIGAQAPAAQVPATQANEAETAGVGIDSIDWNVHQTFTWFILPTPMNDYFTSYNDEPVANYLMHRFNVTIEFEQPVVGTESDTLALKMASGRFSDAIDLVHYDGSIPQLYEDGLIIDISHWLDYMPNFRHHLETNPDFARAARDDLGRILILPVLHDAPEPPFSGLMYRHDILETMTDGNVQFPSGNDVPTTIEDWEYMLPLFQAYFHAAGFVDYAPLIIPPQGAIHFGALMNSFGAFWYFYVRDDTVVNGLFEPAMFEYISTMRDWFERGWIHHDFITRTGDMFFNPNPPLVFGGAVGAWYGRAPQLGDDMSVPELGMNFDVRAAPSPMAEGITHRDMLARQRAPFRSGGQTVISSANPDIGRLLAVIDFLYSDEARIMLALGLNADQIPPGFTLFDRMGMPDGTYSFDAAGNPVLHQNLDVMGGHILHTALNGVRLPGFRGLSYSNALRSQEVFNAHELWTAHDAATETFNLPEFLAPTAEEGAILSANSARFMDVRNQMLPQFIMGTIELTEQSWSDFLDQIRDAGMEESREIWQAVYDRYLAR